MIESGSVFVITMILTRYLKPAHYGDFAFINALVLAFQPLVNLELNTILIREMAKNPEKQSLLLGGGILLKGILLLGFVVAAVIMEQILGLSGILRIAFYLAVLGEIFQQVSWVIVTVFFSREKMGYDAVLTLLFRTVSLMGIALVAWFGRHADDIGTGFLLVFAVMTSAHLVRMVAGAMLLRWKFQLSRLTFDMAMAVNLLKQMWVMGIATFCTGLSLRVDIYILKALQGPEAVSIFHVPHMLVLQMQILAIAIVTALFPVFSRWGDDRVHRDRFNEARDLSIRILSIAGLWIAAGTVLFAYPIIMILGGRAFVGAETILVVLSGCIPILFLNLLGANLLTSLKKQQTLIYGAAVSLVVNVGLDFLLIPVYGPMGAAWATVISYLLQLIIVLGFLRRFGEESLSLRRSVGLPLILTIGVIGTGMILTGNMIPLSVLNIVIRGGLLVILGALILATQPSRVREHMKRIVRRGRPAGPPLV